MHSSSVFNSSKNTGIAHNVGKVNVWGWIVFTRDGGVQFQKLQFIFFDPSVTDSGWEPPLVGGVVQPLLQQSCGFGKLIIAVRLVLPLAVWFRAVTGWFLTKEIIW